MNARQTKSITYAFHGIATQDVNYKLSEPIDGDLSFDIPALEKAIKKSKVLRINGILWVRA